MPVVVAVLGVAGGAAAAAWIIREARRVNAILHPEGSQPVRGDAEASAGETRSRLRRDASGIYRPE